MRKDNDFLQLDIAELHDAFKKHHISPVDVVETLFPRLDRFEYLNTYITVCKKEALHQAKQAEKMYREGQFCSPLTGIPIGLKDLIHTKGIRTTMGSGVYKDFVPVEDAAVAKRLKELGSVIIGKQNTHELAYGTTGGDSYFGPIRNPYDSSKIAGGSSGGSAAATAARLCWGAIGTDTSGSIRIPASICGVVGMKPTYGKISTKGIHPLSLSMDHVGPITKTVKDNAIIFDALCGTLDSSQAIFGDLLKNRDLSNMKIGIPAAYFFDDIDDQIKSNVLVTMDQLEELGAKIIEVDLDLPEMKNAMEISSAIDRSEAYTINREIVHDTSNLLGDETRRRILQGAEYRAYEYLLAQELKLNLSAKYEAAFELVDAILTPTIPILPQKIGVESAMINGKNHVVRGALMRFTFVANYIGIPSITLPCGIAAAGLPIGAQLMGKWGNEAALYHIANELENILDSRKALYIA